MENNKVIDNNQVVKEKEPISKDKVIKIVLTTLIYVFCTLWALLAVAPVLWTLFSSFKYKSDILLTPFTFPGENGLTFENYSTIFKGSLNISTAYFWSLFISGFTVILTIITALLAAFVLARYDFKGKTALALLVVGCMMFPGFSLLVPLFNLLVALGLHNTAFGVVLPQVALNLGFTITLLVGFLKGLPIEVEESACIDGASVPRVLLQIVIPMAKSAIVTCVIFIFIWSYNDLFMQKIVIQSQSLYPISMLLDTLNSRDGGFDGGRMAAASTMVCVPIIAVYCIFQRHIIKGLTAGAVKG